MMTPVSGVPGASVPPGCRVVLDQEYAVVDGVSLKLDVAVPPAGGSAPPLLVWIHGGAWLHGDKTVNQSLFCLGEGFATASIDYRKSRVAKSLLQNPARRSGQISALICGVRMHSR